MKTLINYTKRPYVYSILLTIGMLAIYSIVHTSAPGNFFIAAISLYLLLLFELFSTKYYASSFRDQYELEPKDIRHRRAHWVHHLIMPSVLYVSLTLFIFVNSQLNIALVVALLSFILFSILFINIKAYYESKYKLERNTANVYDVISIASIFMLSYAVLVLTQLTTGDFLISGLLITGMLMVMGYLTLSRYHLINKSGGLALLAMLIIYINTFLILLNFEISVISHAVISTFVYYYYAAFINHSIDKSLSLKVIIEYLSVFVLIFVIILLGNI